MLSQNELSVLLSITRQHLSGVKTGKYNAGPKLAKKLAKRTSTKPTLWMVGSEEERRAAIVKLTGNKK